MEELEIGGGFLELFVRDVSDGVQYGSGNYDNSSNSTHDDHHGYGETGTVLFLFVSFGVGALVRHVLKHTPIPYTVILICLGLIFGAASNAAALYNTLYDFTAMARMDPHLMQFVFLPTLIFESAFVMDVHTFKKTMGQCILLAGPGLIVSTVLTALIAKYIFTYNWSWVTALLIGAILSATDPVAVVAILRDVGASKQLGTIIEGESLLNDGAAIVIFNLLLRELMPGQSQTALEMFIYFIRVAFGGPAFGYLMAKISIFWLANVFNDALVEITITLVSTYITFYVGEGIFGVSGVLAVVTLGIELNSRRTNISPEVEVFLHRFWGMLGYLANTMIFILVGVVISQQAFSGVTSLDWMYMFALYIGIMVIRFFVIGALTPLLVHIGYSIDWKQVIVITWGGLRGAVGLSLALVVLQTSEISLPEIGSKVLFHTAGIVILTLLINASTVAYLLRALGMSDISNAKRLTMATAVRRVNEAKQRAVNMLKSDRFLADAHWDIVEEKTVVYDPYHSQDTNEIPASSMAAVEVASNCPTCEAAVPRAAHPKELAELTEEVRQRMLKAEKTSYWRQFEQGMLGRQAVLALINLTDVAMDTPDRLITVNDIRPYWKIPFYLTKARSLCFKALHWKSSGNPPRPKFKACLPFHTLTTHFLFEWVFFFIIFVNIIIIIVELATDNTDTHAVMVLCYLNYTFCCIYFVEFVLKIIGLRQHYFRSKWNVFDFIILMVSIVDVIVEQIPNLDVNFSPAILRVVTSFRVLRMGRILRLIKLALPMLIQLVDTMINSKLRFGYDIGKGFVVGVEEMLQQFDRFGSILHQSIAKELHRRTEESRLDVIRSLGLMRKEHPGVALSVKTHHAIRSVLNHCKDTIERLLESGVLDEPDAELLLKTIEVKMKRLERTPASLPLPDPHVILLGVSWLSRLDPQAVAAVQSCAKLEQFEHNDIMIRYGERAKGLYIIVSGLVKVLIYQSMKEKIQQPPSPVENSPNLLSQPVDSKSDQEWLVSTDYCGAGSVIGEAAVLEYRANNLTVKCSTDVQAFFISVEDIEGMLQSFPALEEQLWRIYGIHTATELLVSLPEYQDWPTSKLLLLCEGAYIASLPTNPVGDTFEIQDEYKEVVVMSGEVRCVHTRERLVAPIVVPKSIKHLLLSAGQPRLLVIPDVHHEGVDSSKSQDQLFTVRKKRKLTERLLRCTWTLLLRMSMALYPVLLGALSRISSICQRKRVHPQIPTVTIQEHSDNNITSQSVLELKPITVNPVVSNSAMPTKEPSIPMAPIEDATTNHITITVTPIKEIPANLSTSMDTPKHEINIPIEDMPNNHPCQTYNHTRTITPIEDQLVSVSSKSSQH